MGAVERVENLRKEYGDTVAAGGVSFEVRRGEIFGIVGPDGAGKSTTVECLTRVRVQDGGTVEVLGLDPRRRGGELQAALPDDIKVWEALDLYASFYRAAADWRKLMAWGIYRRSATPG